MNNINKNNWKIKDQQKLNIFCIQFHTLTNIILPNISPDESPVSASEWQTTFCYFFILKPNQTSRQHCLVNS